MKIHTLNGDDDDNRPNLEASDEEDSGEEGGHRQPPQRPQEYYVGGSEHSGQQVLGPRGPAEDPMGMFAARLVNQSGPPRGVGAPVRVTVEMFDDGFTVDDSVLRPYHDPANIAFMDQLKRRETPAEFIIKYGGRPIDVHCFKKPGNYVFKPFSGVGHRLGGAAPPAAKDGSKNEK